MKKNLVFMARANRLKHLQPQPGPELAAMHVRQALRASLSWSWSCPELLKLELGAMARQASRPRSPSSNSARRLPGHAEPATPRPALQQPLQRVQPHMRSAAHACSPRPDWARRTAGRRSVRCDSSSSAFAGTGRRQRWQPHARDEDEPATTTVPAASAHRRLGGSPVDST